ncbi:MAG: hypothetical protein AB8B87_21280 [Granulosicoccus sp.]
MNHDLAFLHTADVHIASFQNIVDSIDPSIRVRHDVNSALLSDAIAQGMTIELAGQIDQAMELAADTGAKAVVCTCSTIGGVAEASLKNKSAAAMRIDRAMSDLAVKNADRILVVAAVQSTLEPTMALLRDSAATASRHPEITMELVEGAWTHFENNRQDEYFDCIAKHIRMKQDVYDCFILAQASMAPVVRQFTSSDIRVLASPEPGVMSAIEKIRM